MGDRVARRPRPASRRSGPTSRTQWSGGGTRPAAIPVLPSRRALWLLAGASALLLVSTASALAADLLVVALAYWDGRRARPPTISRKAPVAASLGGAMEVSVALANDGPRPVRVRVTDDLDPLLKRLPAAGRRAEGARDPWEDGVRVAVPAGSTVRLSYRARPRTRGFLRLGAVHARTLGPLGLGWARSVAAAEHVVRVQPGLSGAFRRKDHAVRRPASEAGPRRIRRRGEGSEFESLREYVRGDDPRAIDWKASARRSRYVVRNYQTERNQNLVLAIDAGRHMREHVLDRERADFALAAAMLLAGRARAYGDRVGALVFDDRVRHLSPPRRVDMGATAEILSGVETRLVEPNYPLAIATLARTVRKRSLVALFCDVIDGDVSRALAASLARIARTHLPMAVAIRNPELERVAARTPADEAEAYRRAAAEELVQARAAALQTMRRAGILVVDADPGDALAATLDQYAEVKERGLL